jgi:hypothetical protein
MEKLESYVKWEREAFESMMLRKFPLIFRDLRGPMSETCMAWGVDISSGWYDLFHDLCVDIDKELDNLPYRISKRFKALQIKEKFGGLRFYTSNFYYSGDSEDVKKIQKKVDKLIADAENLTYETCETCGEPGRLRKKGWWVTLCDTHQQERERAREKSIKEWERGR